MGRGEEQERIAHSEGHGTQSGGRRTVVDEQILGVA